MDPDLRKLVAAARTAQRRAHAPYSGFRVGVALRDSRGAMHLGANQENVAYPLGICAERVALTLWRSGRQNPIEQVVIYTEAQRPTPPCGLCRDALRAWAPAAQVYLASPAGIQGPFQASDWSPAEET